MVDLLLVDFMVSRRVGVLVGLVMVMCGLVGVCDDGVWNVVVEELYYI